MDSLPPLCYDQISISLTTLFQTNEKIAAVQTAGSLALVGDERFSDLARKVYDACVDPGCLAAATAVVDMDTEERKKATRAMALPLVDLREACKTLGITTSGTKAALQEKITKACASAASRLERPIEELPSCPVRDRIKAIIVFCRKSSRLLTTASAAEEPFRLSRKVIPFEQRRNPVYRNAAPMRLYSPLDLAGPALKKHGPGEVPMAIVAEKKDAARKEKLDTKNRNKDKLIARRKIELDAMFERDRLTGEAKSLKIILVNSQSELVAFLQGSRAVTVQQAEEAIGRPSYKEDYDDMRLEASARAKKSAFHAWLENKKGQGGESILSTLPPSLRGKAASALGTN